MEAFFAQMQRSYPLTEGSVSLGLLRFAIPILLATALQSLTGVVNSIWVGHYLGEAALAATSSANSVFFLVVGASLGMATAATILVGNCIGADDLSEAKRVVSTTGKFFAGVSIPTASAGLLLSKPLLVLMQTPPPSLPLAVTYLQVMFLALPFVYLFAFVMAVLRGAGDSRTPFVFLALAVVLDIGLNPLLIFGLGPIPAAGIAGSALASLLAQTVALGALVVQLYRRQNPLCPRRREFAMGPGDWAVFRSLVRVGLPVSAEILVIHFGGVLMLALINRMGVDVAAAFGASIQLWLYIVMPAGAIGMAVTTMAAQNFGARQWHRVHAVARIGILYNILLTGAMVFALNMLDTHVFGLFLPEGSKALSIASCINRIVSGSFMLTGVSTVLVSVMRATGATVAPVFLELLPVLLVQYPLAYLLLDRGHATAVWWSIPAASALTAMLSILFYCYGNWRTARLIVPSSQ